MNYGYHSARAKGAAVRTAYRALLPALAGRAIQPPAILPLEVFAYSGESALPEQVASIRSFLRHAGRPRHFTVVSDGTYTRRSLDLLRSIDSCVALAEFGDWLPNDVPAGMRGYLSSHPTGKQLALIMSLPAETPVLYVDSDVLFFPGARDLALLAAVRDVPAFYQADCQFSGDERLLRSEAERMNPANTGVLILFRRLNWSLGVERFLQMDGAPTFFTNQTITHLTMHANGAEPLDAARYVLQLDDQFVFADRHASGAIALRHYVNPVRHKFWTSVRRVTA